MGIYNPFIGFNNLKVRVLYTWKSFFLKLAIFMSVHWAIDNSLNSYFNSHFQTRFAVLKLKGMSTTLLENYQQCQSFAAKLLCNVHAPHLISLH